jgi:hypothetical protein
MKNKLNYNTVKNTTEDAIVAHIAWLLDNRIYAGLINPFDAELAKNCIAKLDLLRKYYTEIDNAQPIRIDAWGITDDVLDRVFKNDFSDDDAYIFLLNYF